MDREGCYVVLVVAPGTEDDDGGGEELHGNYAEIRRPAEAFDLIGKERAVAAEEFFAEE